MNPITPQQLHLHTTQHGEELASAIRAERARRTPLPDQSNASGPGPARRRSRIWKYAFGGLAALAGAAGVHAAGAEARPPAPDPLVMQETVMQDIDAPACLPQDETGPVRHTPVHRRVRDRFTPIPI
jgi:hypothetical protein